MKDNTRGKALPFRLHRDTNTTAPKYLIKNLLPERGTALVSGQWGSYKTFLLITLFGAIGTGKAPIRGYPVKRRGACLIFTPEGSGGLQSRIEATSIAHHDGVPLPIYYVTTQVCLSDPISVQDVIMTADVIANDAREKFDLPLVAIGFDTLSACAGYKSGEENDTAVNQRLMDVLKNISDITGALVAATDHLGKNVEAGTRGSTAKEGAADCVLIALGDRALDGKVTNSRLAIRKLRDGLQATFPFQVKVVPLGLDEDEEPFSSLAIEFLDSQNAVSLNDNPRLTRNQQTLFSILHEARAAGLSLEEWNERARQAGLGVKRKADLYDLREALKSKKIIREYGGRWNVVQ